MKNLLEKIKKTFETKFTDEEVDYDTDTDCAIQDDIYDIVKKYFFYIDGKWRQTTNLDNLEEVRRLFRKIHIHIGVSKDMIVGYHYGYVFINTNEDNLYNENANLRLFMNYFFNSYRDGYGLHIKNPRTLFEEDWNELNDGESYQY